MDNTNYNDFYNDEYLRLMEMIENSNYDEFGNIITSSNDIYDETEEKLELTDVEPMLDLHQDFPVDNLNYNSEEIEIQKNINKMKKRNLKNRCGECNCKLKLVNFTCKCNIVFCNKHRMVEDHTCYYDHKNNSREILKKNNPKIVKEKLNKI